MRAEQLALWSLLLGLAASSFSPSPCVDAAPVADPALKTFDDVLAVVKDSHWDDTMNGLRWDDLTIDARRVLGPHPTEAQVRLALDQLLARLGPSAPRLYSEETQEFWALSSMFSQSLEGGRVRQVGAWFERRGARWFVRTVFPGSPAERAGLTRGDEIASVDGNPFSPVAAFRDLRPGASATVAYRRLPWETPRTAKIETVGESLQESMLRAVTRGQRVYELNGKRIAYVALPATSDDGFRKALTDAARAAQAEADALVLDLRGGYGGAGRIYLEPFFPSKDANGEHGALFDKPLVTLVDGGTAGGREWLASLIQREGRGRLVGAPTAGRYLPSRAVEILPRHLLLYLELKETHPPGAHPPPKEGQGLTPDIPVDDTLMYAAGDDPQLKAALASAAGLSQKPLQ